MSPLLPHPLLQFTTNTEAVLQQVFRFVGADPALHTFQSLPPGMAGAEAGLGLSNAAARSGRAAPLCWIFHLLVSKLSCMEF